MKNSWLITRPNGSTFITSEDEVVDKCLAAFGSYVATMGNMIDFENGFHAARILPCPCCGKNPIFNGRLSCFECPDKCTRSMMNENKEMILNDWNSDSFRPFANETTRKDLRK